MSKLMRIKGQDDAEQYIALDQVVAAEFVGDGTKLDIMVGTVLVRLDEPADVVRFMKHFEIV